MERRQTIALEILASRIRVSVLEQIESAGKGHVGGSMSVADLMAVLYAKHMRVDPDNPGWEMRDRLVMSKGHSGCALYAALMLKGFFPESWGRTLNKLSTRLPSHCDRRKTPGIDMSTGSLGQGLSVASGIAWANALKGLDVYTYCILGDGECQEGQVWEAMMFAGFHRQGKLIAFVDMNGKQVDGEVGEIMPVKDIAEHARLFGWHCQTANGHDVEEISQAIDEAKTRADRPSMIVLNTIKGYGCFAQNMRFNHGIAVSPQQLAQSKIDLQEKISRLEAEMEGLA
ncbi:MAG: transketolase [Clostridia bacterium]|nr:transketolase [Clostridia bacterium]